MKKTKVLQYIHSLNDGGAETLIKDYATLIDTNRFDVSILLTRDYDDSANIRRVKDAGVTIHTIYKKWNVFIKIWHETVGKWWYVKKKIKKLIEKENIDIIHSHLGTLKYLKNFDDQETRKLFYTCHSTPQRTFCSKKKEEFYSAKKLLKKNKLQIIALHKDMAKEINEMFDIDHTAVIRNGIDFRKFREINIDKEEKRKELGISNDAYVVGHVGRFNSVKNHKYLVEVFREVAAKLPKAYLLMVGAGDHDEIEKKLSEYGLENRYMILSHRKDVNEILKAMDVFVFPSICEGLGIALIEAQVSGLKCVASDTIPEEAFKTEKAIALPLGDAKRWAEVILDENAKGIPHGNLDDYDMNKEIKRLEKLYMGTLDE